MIPYVVDFKEEKEQLELWVPRDSDFYKNAKWLGQEYPSKSRFSQVLLTTKEETILTRDNIEKLFYVHDQITHLQGKNGSKLWIEVCAKRPTQIQPQCAENSLLEIWAKDGSYSETNQTLLQKTEAEILIDINTTPLSGIFNVPVNLNAYLGGIERSNSKIKSAKALSMSLQADLDREGSNLTKAIEFEQEFIYFLGNYSKDNENSPVNVHYFCQKSMSDAIGSTIKGDVTLLSMGFIIVFIYIMLMLGRFNSVEQRAYLSMLGVVAILLGTAVSYGVCQLLGVWYGPMNSILPFLLLGIGIDDMFVLVQGLTNVQKDEAYSRYLEHISYVN